MIIRLLRARPCLQITQYLTIVILLSGGYGCDDDAEGREVPLIDLRGGDGGAEGGMAGVTGGGEEPVSCTHTFTLREADEVS